MLAPDPSAYKDETTVKTPNITSKNVRLNNADLLTIWLYSHIWGFRELRGKVAKILMEEPIESVTRLDQEASEVALDAMKNLNDENDRIDLLAFIIAFIPDMAGAAWERFTEWDLEASALPRLFQRISALGVRSMMLDWIFQQYEVEFWQPALQCVVGEPPVHPLSD